MSQTQPIGGAAMRPKKSVNMPAAIIGIIIMFGFGWLPPFAGISPMGMKVLGIFIGVIFLWSFCDLLWSSLLGIAALVIVGYAPLPRVVQMSFGNTVSVLVLFALIFFGAVQHSGITRYIARFFLTRKIINGRPAVFNFIFIYTAYVLAAISANVLPALIFMWAILYDVLKETGYKKGNAYTTVMIIGVFFGCVSGQAAKPFTGSALMLVGAYEQVAQAQIGYLQYMLFGFLMSTLGIVIYSLLIKYVFRPDMSKIADISIEHFQRDALPPMSAVQKIMGISLVLFFVLVLLPSFVPKSVPGIALLSRIGPLGVCMIIIAAFCLIPVEGKPIVNFREIASKYIVWDVYLLICMAMAISAAMTSKGMGITEFITQYLSPILGGHSFNVFVAVAIIFCVGITQFANNGVMGVLFMPMLKVFAEQSGGSFEATAVILIFALHMAFLTPAASPYAAFMYGNTDWLDKKDILKYSLIIALVATLMYVIAGIPLLKLIYG